MKNSFHGYAAKAKGEKLQPFEFDPGELGAFKQSVGRSRKRRICVLKSLPRGELPFPLFEVVADPITLCGSFVSRRQGMAGALTCAAAGKLKRDIELRPWSAINEFLEQLKHGKVASCVVFDFTKS